MSPKSVVRLHAILPRAGHSAVVFRRGPSKCVQLIRWELRDDTFEYGQWFKGRIYERRADLSPSGDRLVYFAANHKQPFYSWTAVSKPPYLTALALWPKGDCWGGGALFDGEGSILLNHREPEMEVAEKFNLPRWFSVKPLGARPGWGEDNPIYHMRLIRDGWNLAQKGQETKSKGKYWITYDPPYIYSKPFSVRRKAFQLHVRTLGLHEKDGSWYVDDFLVEGPKPGQISALGRADWADIDKNGDVLLAKDGALFRTSPDIHGAEPYKLDNAKMLCDFTESSFAEMPPSEEALSWK
jgi:hypothetical protein